MQLEKARWRRKSGLEVEGVHWRRALVGAFNSLATTFVVVRVQESQRRYTKDLPCVGEGQI
jgi:hypothetical protein